MHLQTLKTFVQSKLSLIAYIPLILAIIAIVFVMGGSSSSIASSSSFQWYQVDTHQHSTFSAEALTDIGIISQLAQDSGYDAVFLTDHHNGSTFHINNLTANYMIFEDDYTRWETEIFGDLDATTNELSVSPDPVNTGSASLHLMHNSDEYGETFVWTKRGPNFRSGDIILDFSVYPVQIEPDAGAYVSVSIGGDPTVEKTPRGYTTDGGVVSPGKSTVLVWQLGTPRSISTEPNARVLTYTLPYTLNTWNQYTINISDALDDIPTADHPLDYNGLTHLKMAVAADNGTAEAYFDTYSIIATSPVDPADEYVYRTSVVADFDIPNVYRTLPSMESGQTKHTQNFNFGITDPSDYVTNDKGSDTIPYIQQTGYPAQLNHPDVTIDPQEVINTQAHSADIMEVRRDEWIDVWDDILEQDVPLIGAWSSDSHRGVTQGKSATFIYSPALDLASLLKSLFEGRVYNARNDFAGRAIFNLDSTSQDPYPARYPIYISDALGTMDVSLDIDDGLDTDWTVHWVRNDEEFSIENPPGDAYSATKSILLSDGANTYVRVHVRRDSGSLRVVTQPILFRDITSLPVDKTIHITEITTPNSIDYNKLQTKGITGAVWSTVNELLQITLEDPLNSLVRLHMQTVNMPQRVKVDTIEITAATSLANFEAASGSSWFYDSTDQLLYLKVLHATTIAQLNVEFGAPDIDPPTVPTNLTATAINLGQVDLAWSASTDNVAVGGYTIYRDGNILATVGPTTLSYSDTSVSPATTYAYTVDAFDTSNNYSAQSTPAVVTTPSSGTFIFTAEADSYVSSSSPTTNYGTSTVLRADNSPDIRSYLRFNVQGLSGVVVSAKVQVYAETTSSIGYDIYDVADNGWGETSIIYNNAPPLGGFVNSSGAYSSGAWTEVDVTSLVTGNGLVSMSMTTSSNTVLKYTSRDASTNVPVLVVEVAATMPTSTPTATPTETPTPTPTSLPGTFTFTPVADSYVHASNPSTNYGTSARMYSDASPDIRSYLRFDVQGLNGFIVSATLRIYAETSSSIGYTIHDVTDDSWTETGINYSNAPTVGSAVDTSGSYSAGWTEVDVTSLITGNGLTSFAQTTTSNTRLRYTTRDASSNAPELIIETSAQAPTATPTLTPTPTAQPGTFTFMPVADAYVNDANPTTNYGLSTTLRADQIPDIRSYLRFDVQGLAGVIADATLRVFAETGSSTGYDVRDVTDDGWSETGINYNNAPAVGAVVDSSGSISSGGVWTEVDVTSLVTGDGLASFALTTPNNTAVRFASRQTASGNLPELVIQTQSGGSAMLPPLSNTSTSTKEPTMSTQKSISAEGPIEETVVKQIPFVTITEELYLPLIHNGSNSGVNTHRAVTPPINTPTSTPTAIPTATPQPSGQSQQTQQGIVPGRNTVDITLSPATMTEQLHLPLIYNGAVSNVHINRTASEPARETTPQPTAGPTRMNGTSSEGGNQTEREGNRTPNITFTQHFYLPLVSK